MRTIEDFKKSLLWCWENKDKTDDNGVISIPEELSMPFGFHRPIKVRANLNQAFHWLLRELTYVSTSGEKTPDASQKRLPPPTPAATPAIPYREPLKSEAEGGTATSTGTQNAAVKGEKVVVEPFKAEPAYVPDFQVPNE